MKTKYYLLIIISAYFLFACKKQELNPVFENLPITQQNIQEYANPKKIEITDSITGAHSIIHIEYNSNKLVSRIYNEIKTPALGEDSTIEQLITYENGLYKSIETRVNYISAIQKNNTLFENFTYKNGRPYKYQYNLQTISGVTFKEYSYYVLVRLGGYEYITKIKLNDTTEFDTYLCINPKEDQKNTYNLNYIPSTNWQYYHTFSNYNGFEFSKYFIADTTKSERWIENKTIKKIQFNIMPFLKLGFNVFFKEKNIIRNYQEVSDNYFPDYIKYQTSIMVTDLYERDSYKTIHYQTDALNRPLEMKTYYYNANNILLEAKKYKFTY